MLKLAPVKRRRLILKDKKEVIDKYITFLGTIQDIDEDTRPNDVAEDRCEKSIRMFIKCEVMDLEDEEKMKGSHKYLITDNTYIEGADFDSCYARYYNCSTQVENQNVCVEKLPNWTNPQRAVCFVASNEIAAGTELVIAYDQGFTRNNNKRYKTVHSQFATRVIEMAAAFPEFI
jgi:hypothetical protein